MSLCLLWPDEIDKYCHISPQRSEGEIIIISQRKRRLRRAAVAATRQQCKAAKLPACSFTFGRTAEKEHVAHPHPPSVHILCGSSVHLQQLLGFRKGYSEPYGVWFSGSDPGCPRNPLGFWCSPSLQKGYATITLHNNLGNWCIFPKNLLIY